MDTAVSLVQAYLQVNGYFTVCEYPVLEASRHGAVRTATDLDVLAFRFPGAGREVRRRRRSASGTVTFEVDPVLGATPGRADMIVGEVKEGRAHFNPAASDPLVIAAALARFGCCSPEHTAQVAGRLIREGTAETPHGHVVRLVAFGGAGEPQVSAGRRLIGLDHVTGFLQSWLAEEWSVLRHAQLKVPALDLLALLHKCGKGAAP